MYAWNESYKTLIELLVEYADTFNGCRNHDLSMRELNIEKMSYIALSVTTFKTKHVY